MSEKVVDFQSYYNQKVKPASEAEIRSLHEDTIEQVRKLLGEEAMSEYLSISPLSDFGPQGSTPQPDNVRYMSDYRPEIAQSYPVSAEYSQPARPRRRGLMRRLGFGAWRGGGKRAA